MNLNNVIRQLKLYCPTFQGRVAGAAEFSALPENAAVQTPSAFVIPLDDNPAENESLNTVRQPLEDNFGVVVALSNLKDERGQGVSESVHLMRRELWRALLGWSPDHEYNGVFYQGGSLLKLDRARCWYRYDFAAEMEIGPEDGFQFHEAESFPHFDGANIKIDFIDPHDQNISQSGPDGRIDAEMAVPKNENLP